MNLKPIINKFNNIQEKISNVINIESMFDNLRTEDFIYKDEIDGSPFEKSR